MTASTMKAENSRANFEAWVREEFPVWGKYLLWSESLDAYGYSTTNLMYRAWQASRAAIVVELPDEVNVLLNHLEDVLPFDVFNLIDVKKWNAVSSLSATGITVKGDSDDSPT